MSSVYNALQNIADNAFSGLSNPTVSLAVCGSLILYSGLVAPKLPGHLPMLFNNSLFNLLAVFVIFLLSMKSESVALLAALAFVISLVALNKMVLVGSLVGNMRHTASIDEVVPQVAQHSASVDDVPSYNQELSHYAHAPAPTEDQYELNHRPLNTLLDESLDGTSPEEYEVIGDVSDNDMSGYSGTSSFATA